MTTPARVALLRRLEAAGGSIGLRDLTEGERGSGVVLAGYARLSGGGLHWSLTITQEGRNALRAVKGGGE